VLRHNRFWRASHNEALGVKDLTWINASGAEMRAEDWADANTRCFGMMIDGRAQPTGIGRRGEDATLLLVLNGHHDIVQFTLPECAGGTRWTRVLDTNMPHDEEAAAFTFGDAYGVTARSLLLFALA
jgi:glycogen operon protein